MFRYGITVFILSLAASCGKTHLLKEVIKIETYPSASGIEYYNEHIYLMGDDARQLLILDTNLHIKDSILLYPGIEKRLPKDTKSDLESITKLMIGGKNQLLLVGSGSLAPYRNAAWLINPENGDKQAITLDTFYSRLQFNGIKEINIEGSCSIPGSMVLSNRGNKTNRKNQLIITNNNFWNQQAAVSIFSLIVGSNADTSVFNGVSGLAYATRSDRLVLTVSTEDTRNAYDDGAIGKSYIWIIKNISGKKRWKSVNPDQVIDLDAIDPRFKGQKIESVCVTKETKHFLHLVLAADNDDGSSTLFKLLVEKK